MSTPKVAVIEEQPAVRCAYCARWAARVVCLNGETLCGPCESLFRKVGTAEHARDEALRQAAALQTSLVKARREIEDAWTQAAGYCRKVIQTREVARWLLAEWAGPENWADALKETEAKFGLLDWLREKEETP